MPRAPRLPDRLAYLEPVRKQLAALPSAEVNEDMDTALFEAVLRERTKGLAMEEATEVLGTDREELQQWLARPGNENNRLYFFYGFLLIAADSVDELLNPSVEPLGEIEMEIPPAGQLKRYDAGWELRLGGSTLLLFPNNKAGFELHVETYKVAADVERNSATWSVTPVTFGAVNGVKFERIATALRLKEVHYALEVPGGYCTAQITGPGTDWPEADFEQCFSSIRVTGAP